MRQARGQSAHCETGDHRLARMAVAPVGSMHHTVPRAERVPKVWCNRSLLTLAATTGPGQSTMAGTARQVVFPLCVGPTTTTECAGSAATVARPNTPGNVPSTSRPGTRSPRNSSRRNSHRRAQCSPRRPWDRPPLDTKPAPRADTAAHSTPPRASGRRASSSVPPTQRPAMAPSVSTMRRSMALNRCWTRKERWPTFHSATPRRSWGSSSVSVEDSDNNWDAAASSPGAWA